MANLFLASEILEMNVTEEHNGAAFYRALSENARSELLRKAAAEISQQELKHEAHFSKLLASLPAHEPAESYPGEYDGYVQQLLRNKMFSDEADAIATAMGLSDKAAVEFAMQTEQATLNLLRELEQHVDPRELPMVQQTITEEEDHLTQLKKILTMLS